MLFCVWEYHLLAAKAQSWGAEDLQPDRSGVAGQAGAGVEAGETLSGSSPLGDAGIPSCVSTCRPV